MKGFSDESKSDKIKEHTIRWQSWDQGQAFLALSSLYRRDEKDDPWQLGQLYRMCFHENFCHQRTK